ncbi:hypothetical protein ANN_06458 [Periplaneta americana]|uniref:Uncharacterized protein n=1 Tax=Periplaneta americana TaxID=6978 RepID=A0ABQ8TF75_PERAM|nr:hypothetical protein ANN_06458 [Periplaneta americana]
MSPRSSTEIYPAFARIGLRESPGRNLNQITCPERDLNPGYLVTRPEALTITPQVRRFPFRVQLLLPSKTLIKIYHHGMARPQVANRGNRLQIWRVAANILNKQLRTPDEGLSSSLVVERRPYNPSHRHTKQLVTKPQNKIQTFEMGRACSTYGHTKGQSIPKVSSPAFVKAKICRLDTRRQSAASARVIDIKKIVAPTDLCPFSAVVVLGKVNASTHPIPPVSLPLRQTAGHDPCRIGMILQSVHNGDVGPLLTFFTDEAWFHLHGHVSTHNNRYWATENPHIIHEVPHHAANVGVWCAVKLTVFVCDIPLFKYTRLTSCDVERSFSQFKSFRDNRHALVMENLEMTFVVHCNSLPITSTQVWLVRIAKFAAISRNREKVQDN